MQANNLTVGATASRRLPVYALMTANAVSLTGNSLSAIAIPWFVLQTTGSPFQAGLISFFNLLPLAFAGFFGGVIVDRLGFKTSSIVSDLASGVAVGLIPLFYTLGWLPFWLLAILVTIGAILDVPGNAARQSLLPDLAQSSGLTLPRINSAHSTIVRLTQLVGPPLAGLLIVATGAVNALWLDAASFGISVLLVALFVPRIASGGAKKSNQSYIGQMKEGLAFLQRDRVIVSLITILSVTNLLLNPIFIVLLPVYAKTTTNNALDLGWMIAGFSVGTVSASIYYGWRGHKLSRRLLFVGCIFVINFPLCLLIGQPDPLFTTFLLFIIGLMIGAIGPMVMTVMGERTPAELRGRVFGVFGTLANAAIPLSVLATGFLLEIMRASVVIALLAFCFMLITIIAVLLPAFRELDASVGEPFQAR
jgi:MFS family permease